MKKKKEEKSQEETREKLLELVGNGDAQKVRAFFDDAFWNDRPLQPEWEHLKLALKAGSKPIAQLLLNWGAVATDADLARLRITARDKYQGYVRMLRQCGASLSAEALKEKPVEGAAMDVQDLIRLIPEEWKQVLSAFQECSGAGNPVIGGDTLCDLFNDRAVREVNIFAFSNYNDETNKCTLRAAFRTAWKKLGVARDQLIADDRMLDSLRDDDCVAAHLKGRREGDRYYHVTRTWRITCGAQKTKYNIVFVDYMGDGLFPPRQQLLDRLIGDMDFGICQIFCDGKNVVATPDFIKEAADKQIVLKHENDGAKEHLQQLVRKYPDWKLCEKSRLLLPPSAGDYAAVMMWPH